ncbi:MAG: Uncharacterized protein G01um101416_581 [Microgenomates group bacterium Gr01-1014_16]|nr:MAG: Uncharacterized protein G01um101416_581 [Microgenomates group bacterium Gr01-1014_16]
MGQPDITPLFTLVTSSQSFALLLPQNPAFDAVSCALSLKLCLEQSGKSVLVACPDSITVEFNRLVGIDSITSVFSGRNLIISFPAQTEHVDKINYQIESGVLRLVVSPKPDSPAIDHTRLQFISGGTSSDVIITIDVDQLSHLGHIYENSKDTFHGNQKLVSLSRAVPAQNYTPHQIYDPVAVSLVETTVYIIDSLALPLTTDAASNLLLALEQATQNFQHIGITAATFETAARLLKSGARRHHDQISASQFPTGAIPQSIGTSESVQEIKSTPPSDWMSPKVYRSPMLQ